MFGRNEYYVYGLIDPRNNQPFYIGKGKGYRWRIHLTETREKTDNLKKYNKIQKLLRKGYRINHIKYEKNLTEVEAYDLEEILIIKYGREGIDPIGVLTNICRNNRPPNFEDFDKEKSDSIKEKISKALKGIKRSKETKEKMSKSKKGKESWHKGRQKSIKFKQKISKANKNKEISSETRNKIRLSTIGDKNHNFGSRWINNGKENKKIKGNNKLPDDWIYGRLVNHIVGFRGAK